MPSDSPKNVPSDLPSIRVYLDPPELKDKLKRLAKIKKRRMSSFVCLLIEEAVQKAEEEGLL